MIFEPTPKERRSDLFNFDEEINKIVNELLDPLTRLIVIKGLRRTGKSSILRVSLNEAKLNYILLDMREFSDLDRRTFLYELSEALSKLIKTKKRSIILDNIRAVSFMGMKIDLKGSKEEDPTTRYRTLLRTINEWSKKKKTYFILAIDEAQEIAKLGFDKYLAFVYDNLQNVKIILAGSQVGVLNNILDNPKKPLFGRARIEIETRYFTKKEAKEFLKTGFKEAKIKIEETALNKAIDKLNGVAGWLTLFGWEIVKGNTVENAIRKVTEAGIKIAYEEIQNFLTTRGIGKKRYIEILKALAEGPKKWKELKTHLEINLKRRIPNNQISKYLNELRKYGFIIKKDKIYLIPDPLLKQTILEKF
ncbi:MAG: AAA family ATPase [Candidatus Njordarchaeia archaeon]